MDDEQTCPPEFTFDTCSNLNDCYWHEDTPDDLDFSVMKGKLKIPGNPKSQKNFQYKNIFIFSVQDLIDSGMVEKHGPFTDPINSTEGSIVYVLVADPDDPDQSHNQASISSPTYRDSYVKCEFIFWYYIAGNIGTDGHMSPILVHEDHLHYLDKLYPDSEKAGAWHRSTIGIGIVTHLKNVS